MVANKHISKIIIAVMAVAVVLCFLAIAFSGKLNDVLGGTGVKMEYESKLFDTDEIIDINIVMDENDWSKMLSNAMSEEYYVCNVTINGKTIKNVAIRPKGNTSLSAIASDPDSDRYSLKLEFDHFVDGQTCWGLDKLILNNNYADATNMKEAVIYDMFRHIGAEASLYNYAKVSVNGEYWGVYLALEGVEESFMLRNFGTQDGELYKPDSMEMGGQGSSKSSSGKSSGSSSGGMSMPNMDFSNFDFSNFDMSDFEGMTPPSDGGMTPPSDGGMTPPADGSMTSPSDGGGMSFPSGDGTGFPSEGGTDFPSGGGFGGFGGFGGSSGEDDSQRSSDKRPSGRGGFSGESRSSEDSSQENSGSSGNGFSMGGFSMGGFSMGGGGANLNYTDDDLDSYSTIWDGSITGTSKGDHRRVVTALKNISEGNELEKYLDVDNILKYMAVHTFSVNSDSLSGSMAHNYYLYEYNGQLNMFPWDYNLSLGGMSMGNSAGANDVVNDAIDTPFSGTRFFNALLENEEYLARYHEYLRQLVEEYVQGGRFDEVYSRIRSQIDSLVETDPTAFYNADEYSTAVQMLYETIKLRAQSIEGQLDGTIPSTDDGQRKDSSSLIDASHIDVKAMGQFSMGGGSFGRSSESSRDTEGTDNGNANTDGSGADAPGMGGMPEGSFPDMSSFGGNPPEGMGSNIPGRENTATDTDNAEITGQTETTDGTGDSQDVSFFKRDKKFQRFQGNMPGQSMSRTNTTTIVLYAVCLAAMLAALFICMAVKRRKKLAFRSGSREG